MTATRPRRWQFSIEAALLAMTLAAEAFAFPRIFAVIIMLIAPPVIGGMTCAWLGNRRAIPWVVLTCFLLSVCLAAAIWFARPYRRHDW